MASNNVLSADNQQERPKKLSPWYIVGFVEGEGTFHVAFYKDPRMSVGIKVIPEFHINQSYLRIITLETIKKFFGCGYIKENHRARIDDVTRVYVVRKRDDLLKKIIPFFVKYQLLSNKREDFDKFRKIVNLIDQGGHRKTTGMRRIIKMAYQMNSQGKYRQVKLQELLTFLESSETIRQTPRKKR